MSDFLHGLNLHAALISKIKQSARDVEAERRRLNAIKHVRAIDIVARVDVKSMSLKPANLDRRPYWRASSSSCYCAATYPPCSVCVSSAECVGCGSFELMDEMEVSKHGYICSICDERRWQA